VVTFAEFLCWLKDEKDLAVSTIEGYRTAVASTLKGHTGVDLGKDKDLSNLLANFARGKPKRKCTAPAWNLAVVLSGLLNAPFEPMHLAPLKFVTLKTIFLLAFATGKRRSELHALVKEYTREEGWKNVTLFLDSSFVAKTELAAKNSNSKPLTIPALSKSLGPGLEKDRCLCPVRALRFYLDRTKEIRADKKKLFVAYKKNFKGDISKATISHWIKKAITTAYSLATEEDCNLLQVKAHDVRGMAASWARLQNITLDDILAACTWKSHNTFTSFYLRDLAQLQGDMHRLGPVVAAQHVC
jgi:hypothetical protein